MEKRCTKCGETKPSERFSLLAKAKDGLRSWCKDCVNAVSREHYERNKDRLKPIRKAWCEANRDRMRFLTARWDHENKARRREQRLKRYHADPAKHIAKVLEWRKENYDKFQAYQKRYAELNRERLRERIRRYAQANRDKVRQWGIASRARRKALRAATNKAWRQRNQARCRALSSIKRARKRNATVGSVKEIAAFYAYVKNGNRLRCHYCGKATKKGDRHVDHIVPLARGGAHAVSNLCCSCSFCNMSKHTRTDEEFTGQVNLFR